jgi:DNA-binding transcriptional regulator GbsR (MarR family)
MAHDEKPVVPQPRKMLDERWRRDAMPFVEKLGFNAERQGHPRTAGRVMGWLLVCEPPWQSVAEIALALQCSRSAVNAVVNRMVEFGMFEPVAIPGERTTYYRMNSDGGELLFQNMVANLREMRAIADEGLQALAWREPEANQRLEDLRAMHQFMAEQMPLMLMRWKQRREKGEQA